MFILPLVAGLALALWAPANLDLFIFMMILPAFDFAHIFAVFPALYSRSQSRPEAQKLFWKLGFILLVTVTVLYILSRQWFSILLAHLALFHILRQQVGWVMIARAKRQDPTPRWLDQILIHLIMIAPILWWHSDLRQTPLKYFVEGDLVIPVPAALAQVSVISLIAVFLFYLFTQIRLKVFNPTKNLILLTTFLWFFLGLIYPGSHSFFWMSLILTHGLAYIFFVSRVFRASSDFGPWPWQKQIMAYTGFLILFGLVWSTLHRSMSSDGDLGWLGPLVWGPLVIHYVFDGLIWTRKYFNPEIGA